MPRSNIASLYVDGNRFQGWKTIQIVRGLESLCGAFEVTLVDVLDGKDFRILTQKDVQIKIDSDLVLTGFIDAVDFEIDSKIHHVVIRGRDRTCDLVDSSIPLPLPSAAKGSTVFSFIKRLANAYNVPSVLETENIKSSSFMKAMEGETPAEAIIRLCKDRGWLPTTSPKGELLITASGNTPAHDELTLGKNVKSAKSTYDYTNRFYRYTVTGQRGGAEADLAEVFGGSLSFRGSYVDEGVTRKARELIFPAESAATHATVKRRAQVEALNRAANSQVINVEVQGWRQSNGDLWKHNLIVYCRLPALYIDQQMLISEISYVLNDEGQVCRMKLKRPDAYKFIVSKVQAQKKVGFDAFTR